MKSGMIIRYIRNASLVPRRIGYRSRLQHLLCSGPGSQLLQGGRTIIKSDRHSAITSPLDRGSYNPLVSSGRLQCSFQLSHRSLPLWGGGFDPKALTGSKRYLVHFSQLIHDDACLQGSDRMCDFKHASHRINIHCEHLSLFKLYINTWIAIISTYSVHVKTTIHVRKDIIVQSIDDIVYPTWTDYDGTVSPTRQCTNSQKYSDWLDRPTS